MEKAGWYLAHGVATIWIVVPRTRSVTIVDASGTTDLAADAHLPEPAGLPDLHIDVRSFFVQLDGG